MDQEQKFDRAWRSSAEVWPGAVARILTLALVFMTPWIPAESGVAAWAWVPALVVLACWIFTPELTDRGAVALPTILLPVLFIALYAVLQLIPMPTQLLGTFSPLAQRWWGLVDAAGAEVDPSGIALSSKISSHSVSLYPWGGKQTLAALAFAIVFLLAGARFFRRAVPFSWLSVAMLFVVVAAAAVAAFDATNTVLVWQAGFDVTPIFFFGIAAALGLLAGPGSSGKKTFGLIGLFVAVAALALRTDLTPLIVVAAGGSAVLIGFVLSLLPAKRLTLLLALGIATSVPWVVVSSAGLRVPSEWNSFLRAGSGFGSASLLATARPPESAPATFILRLMVEGGWPALALALIACLLLVETLARLAGSRDGDDRAFLAVGLFLAPVTIAWLGFSNWIAAPYYVMLTSVFFGAMAGRAALAVRSPFTSTAFSLPKLLPAPTFGALLFAASLWAAFVAFAAARTNAALAAVKFESSQQLKMADVDEAIFKLRPLVHHGDALALHRLADARIERFRLQTADHFVKEMKLPAERAWKQSDPAEIFTRANTFNRTKNTAALDTLRTAPPVAQNLGQAYVELRSALAASPLVAEIALRNAQLRFMADTPVNEIALLQLAAERARPDPELFYAIGLEEFYIDRLDRASELWKASLELSLGKLVPIARLLSSKNKGPALLETVLPSTPEAYLTFAETLGKSEANLVLKIAALELAKKSIDKADFPTEEREFQLGRWHAGANDMTKAVAAFRTSVKMKPHNVRYRVALARALELKGDKKNALVEAKQALGTEPNNSAIQEMVKRLTPPPDPNNPPKLMNGAS